METRVEIFRDGSWRKLRLQSGRAIKYNAVINRIGKTDSREISHTNTFSLPPVFQNTDALGINIYNKEKLAKSLNKRFPAKYYIEDKLLQQGFLIINNTSDEVIKVNFIDEALTLTEKWGSTTFKELLEDDSIIKPADYSDAILKMSNYNMSKSEVLIPLGGVGARGYNLALFPNALNAIGDNFQETGAGGRVDDTFNPYQSRPIFNAKALFDLAVESFGYTPLYDVSVDWDKVAKIFMIGSGLDKNKVEDEGQFKVTHPATKRFTYGSEGDKGNGYKLSVIGYDDSVANAIKPNDIPNWVHPPDNNYFRNPESDFSHFAIDYRADNSVLVPDITSATFGDITFSADLYRERPVDPYKQNMKAYSCWENINHASGGNVLFQEIEITDRVLENDNISGVIKKNQLASFPGGSSGRLLGVIIGHRKKHKYREQYWTHEYLFNTVVSETFLIEDIISYDEYGQYIANNIDLRHAAPNKTIKELLSGIMQKEGILLNIDNKTKIVKFFSYSLYRNERDLGNFNNWSGYYQEYVSPLFNTDYGNNYAKKNEISLSSPYLGNSYDFYLDDQSEDSKYKDFTKSPVKIFKDVEGIERVNNTTVPYNEYKNLGLGLVDQTDTVAGLTQVSADGLEQGVITSLQLIANVNYATLPEGVREWYNLVDRAVRGNSTFLIPVSVISTLDLSLPIYIEGLGGFFIIEEIEEYINQVTPVVVKLIKLIELEISTDPPSSSTTLVGNYNGGSDYQGGLTRITNDTLLVGGYQGSSTYTATLENEFIFKELVGTYGGGSTYQATISSTVSEKLLVGSYSGSSIYGAKLSIEVKKFLLRTTDTFVGELAVTGKIKVSESLQVGNDTAAASASNVGTLRYTSDANNSYVDMCMQTEVGTFVWINIVKNSW